MNPTTRGDREYALLAENIVKELEKLELAEEDIRVDSSVTITVKDNVGYQVYAFPNINEAAEYIADRMRR